MLDFDWLWRASAHKNAHNGSIAGVVRVRCALCYQPFASDDAVGTSGAISPCEVSG